MAYRPYHPAEMILEPTEREKRWRRYALSLGRAPLIAAGWITEAVLGIAGLWMLGLEKPPLEWPALEPAMWCWLGLGLILLLNRVAYYTIQFHLLKWENHRLKAPPHRVGLFGVYWDENNNPLCPKPECHFRQMEIEPGDRSGYVECPSCGKGSHLVEDNRKECFARAKVEAKEALAKMIKKLRRE